MKKRLLSILLALCMVVSLFTVTAFAAAPTVATVGDTPYTDLQTALKNANGGTVKLCADITYKGVYQSGSSGHWNGDNNYELSVNNTVTLDLNGYTIKSTGGSSNNHFVLICVGKKGNLTICDSSALQTGKIICDAKTTAAGKLISTVYNNGSLTVTGGTISNTVPAENNTCYAIESVTVESTSVSISGDAVISSTGEALRV